MEHLKPSAKFINHRYQVWQNCSQIWMAQKCEGSPEVNQIYPWWALLLPSCPSDGRQGRKLHRNLQGLGFFKALWSHLCQVSLENTTKLKKGNTSDAYRRKVWRHGALPTKSRCSWKEPLLCFRMATRSGYVNRRRKWFSLCLWCSRLKLR